MDMPNCLRSALVLSLLLSAAGPIALCQENDKLSRPPASGQGTVAMNSQSSKDADTKMHKIEEYFTVEVNGRNPYVIENTERSDVDRDKTYVDDCHFVAPAVPDGGRPLKLATLFVGGAGVKMNPPHSDFMYNYMSMGEVLNSLGYAVLNISGLPREYCTDSGMEKPGGAQCMNWMAIESFRKAYDYVRAKYPIDESGVFVYGESQGGGCAENIVEMSGVPIRCTALDAPSISMQYHQVFKVARRNGMVQQVLRALYGIDSMASYEANRSKVAILDPFSRHLDSELGDIFKDESEVTGNATGFRPGVTLDDVKVRKFRANNSSLFMMVGVGDSTISADVMLTYARMIQNAGGNVCVKPYAVSMFSGGTHGVIQYTGNYATMPSVFTSRTLNVTRGLYDMLVFFRRNGGMSLEKLTY